MRTLKYAELVITKQPYLHGYNFRSTTVHHSGIFLLRRVSSLLSSVNKLREIREGLVFKKRKSQRVLLITRNYPFLIFFMAIHQVVTRPGIYFITFTCHHWLPLIEQTKGYDLVYNGLMFFQQRVMPDWLCDHAQPFTPFNSLSRRSSIPQHDHWKWKTFHRLWYH